MSRKVNWGILGSTADVAIKCLIPAMANSRNATIHAVSSRNLKTVEPTAKLYKILNMYNRPESVLQDPEVDAVYICLPNYLHLPWTIKALAAGKHVLCEKPLAINCSEAQEMAHAAKTAGCLLMEAMMYRFHPRTLAVYDMIKNGRIGTPRIIHTAFTFHIREDILKHGSNYRLRGEGGGGALLDVGCYGVSTACWLLGCEPEKVHAFAHWNEHNADIHTAAILAFPDNKIATIEASFISALQQTYAVIGTAGSIELPHNAYIPWEEDAALFLRGRDEEKGEKMIIPGADQNRLMVEHFSEAILSGGSLQVPMEESINNLVVLDALAQSARSDQAVDLS